MIRFNREQRVIRNLLACALLALWLYASLGFPPCTVKGMCLRFQHDYLLEEAVEPLYVRRTGAERYTPARTLILGRSGDTYVIFRYCRQGFLNNQPDLWLEPALGEGAVCWTASRTIYAAGAFEEAASATATVHLEKVEDGVVQKTRDIVLEGERLSASAFAFSFAETEDTQWLAYWENCWSEGIPEDYQQFLEQEGAALTGSMEDSLGLADLSEYWYRIPAGDGGGYSLPYVDLPCAVTLYGEAGEVLETFRLSVNTAGIWRWG